MPFRSANGYGPSSELFDLTAARLCRQPAGPTEAVSFERPCPQRARGSGTPSPNGLRSFFNP
jgi:hypothetical protein